MLTCYSCTIIDHVSFLFIFFFFQAEDGIRDYKVTGVQTCALPISALYLSRSRPRPLRNFPRILVIEDEAKVASLLIGSSGRMDCRVPVCESPAQTVFLPTTTAIESRNTSG